MPLTLMESAVDTTRSGAILALLVLAAVAFLLLLIMLALGRWVRRSALGGMTYGGRLSPGRRREPMPDPWEESARRLGMKDEADGEQGQGDGDDDERDDPRTG